MTRRLAAIENRELLNSKRGPKAYNSAAKIALKSMQQMGVGMIVIIQAETLGYNSSQTDAIMYSGLQMNFVSIK